MSTTTEQKKPRQFWDPPSEPKSKLGYYRLLSPSCGLRVSPLCFGAMSFGDQWNDFMGENTKENVFKMLDHYYDNGGNFIDTANNYQNEQSETWIGEWIAKRGNRDQLVIATKYTTGFKVGSEPDIIQVNYCGNSRKSMHVSVAASLKKLQTDYIDLLYVHWWDYTTPVEEVMQALNHLVASGKVLYLGISDTPAWIVSKANQYARDHGLAPFVVYQGKWSLATRDLERDIIPMCKVEGLGIAPWNVLGGGMFKTDEELAKLKESGETHRQTIDGKGYEKTRAVVKVLQQLAEKKKTTVTGIALTYVMAKTPYVFPIIGARKIDHLQGSLDALTNVSLSPEEIKALEDASPIDMGFPHDFIGYFFNFLLTHSPAQSFLLGRAAKYDWVEEPKSIQLAKKD